jgi:hypothetical protein
MDLLVNAESGEYEFNKSIPFQYYVSHAAEHQIINNS